MQRLGFAATSLVALSISASACIPPSFPSSDELTTRQLAYNEKQAAQTSDPDVKEFWSSAADCLRTNHKMTMDSRNSPYFHCYDAATKKQIAALEARAAGQHDTGKRDHALKVAACLEQTIDPAPFPYKSVDDCVTRIELRAKDREAIASTGDYAVAEKAGTPKAWLAFLAKHRDDKRSPEIAKRVLAKASDAPSDEQASLDEEIVKAYPLALRDMPAERRLLLVGPPGLRVRDLKKMADAKVGGTIVLARIRSSKEPYKSFDGDELAMLKQFGISDDAVTAMIEVSAKLEDKQKDDEERKAMRAELAALKKLIEDKKASGGTSSGKTVQTKDGPMDVLASCAKRLAAMNVCEQIPFPGSTICKSTTESEFPCPQQ
jgi:hypothetical protein